MITNIRGTLTRVFEDQVRLQVGAVEYQVLVPEMVRRAVQMRIGEELSFHTLEFLEGNPTRGRITPRLVGFLSEPEIEFFELFCTVDGIGIRTALKAMVRPVREVADMIQRQDTQMVATLPGVSGSTAERVIAKLRKKVLKFALMVDQATPAAASDAVAPDVLEEAYLALVSVGHSEIDARKKIDTALAAGKKFKSAQDILQAVYQSRE